MKTLLLVEDDANLIASLSEFLCHEGYAIDTCRTLSEGREARAKPPALCLLDWRLPDGEGIALLREWRRMGHDFPVLFLTARADLVDKVLGLESGANDYITKPFHPRELLARIRVQLRDPAENGHALHRGSLSLDPVSRRVRFCGREVMLKKMEFNLLRLFIENPDQVFSREELLERVWGYECYPTTRTVDTHILQLRQKLIPAIFETVRGIGYRFRPVEND